MKHMKPFIGVILIFVFAYSSLHAQQIVLKKKKFFTTTAGEIIFSFAKIDDNGSESGNIMRWTPWFNMQYHINYDPVQHFGLFSGVNIRNIGFIYDNYKDPESGDIQKKKFRNYTLGIPIGIKIGNLDSFYLYGGYEIEFPFNYKEKTFQNEQKTKFSVWFSKRVPTLYNTVLAGLQFPYGFNLKFKYYFTNFLNKDYTEITNGVEVKPYENLNANIFYFSLSINLFRDSKFYYTEEQFKNSSKDKSM